MYKKLAIIAIILLSAWRGVAQDSITARILLIGDAGQLTNGKNPVVEAAKRLVEFDKKTTVIYLGDNLYKTGLPDNSVPNFATAKAPLDSQVVIAKGTDAKVYFIPGNHDWANGGANGYESIKRVESYIEILGDKNVQQLPNQGCPGPVEVSINDEVALVIMDSQWWLHEEDKPGIESDCETKTKEEVLSELDELLSKNSKKLVLLATHHPFRSYGPHGGYFTLKQHIFPFTDIKPNLYIPLPVIGSAYPLTRAVFGTLQDIKHPLYQEMIKSIGGVVASYKNVIMVSGHEHTLQIIQEKGRNFIVSGSGSKMNRVSKGPDALFVSPETGFVTLDITKSKNVYSKVFTVQDTVVKEAFAQNLLNFTIVESDEKVVKAEPKVEYAYKDTVVIAASEQYKNPNGLRRVMLGTNYRAEWGTPIPIKVFNINKEKGGFKIESLGGGKQTRSLKLLDKNGKEWSLRSIDKDPEKAVPSNLRGTIAQDIVQDAISASHPYAPLTISTLAKAVGVTQGAPELFYIPDDPSFGAYRKIFGNSVAMLENRDPTLDGADTKSTATLTDNLLEDNDNSVKQEDVLTARLLDMFIGDYDRHADQWKWGVADTGKGKLYCPVPRDRDQAFFNSNGLLIKAVARFAIPYLDGFHDQIKDLNEFNMVGKDFDRFFMNSLNEDDWKKSTEKFTAALTDDVIHQAINQLPPKIYALNGALIEKKLRSRRDELAKKAMNYYKFISKEVTVTGSNKKEYFHVEQDGKNVVVSMFKKTDESDTAALIYRRIFDPKITKEIRLYGFNGDDDFMVKENVRTKILIRVIGGKGTDTFYMAGKATKYVYDLNTEKNQFLKAYQVRKRLSSNVSILSYENKYQYDKVTFPLIRAGFNAEDGILLGVGTTIIKHGFRKTPYKSKQIVSALAAPGRKAIQASYMGDFTKAIGNNDLLLNFKMISPTLNNFFGFGNNSVLDPSKPRSFYRTRYKSVDADVLLRKRIGKVAGFSIGPTFTQYSAEFEDNKGRLIDNPILYNPSGIFSTKYYLGGKANFNIEYIDNILFPKRGITWYNTIVSTQGLNSGSRNLTKYASDMTVYANVTGKSRITAILRAGGGKILSKNPEYFQLLTLGANNFNRGYFKNRFSGDASLYTGFETRLKIIDSKSYLVPGEVGLLGFYDIGRVWYKGEVSKRWHASYGTGIYYAPFNLAMISATIGFSPENSLFNFTIGSKVSLTF